MAIGVRYYTPDAFEITPTGVPYAAARLFFYLTATATPQDTFQDVALTTPNTNPVVADANGRFGSIFLGTTEAYRVQFWTPSTTDDPTGAQIWSFDDVGPAAGGAVTNVAGIVGEVRQFAGISSAIPAGWYQCFGQAVSRSTYSALFAAIGTTWGVGDGSTTFNVPDLRGRVTVGLDNMGGTPANVVTAGVSGIAGTTLGAHGGNQALQTHTHALSDPTHTHAYTDPGHAHVIQTVTNGGGTPIGEVTGVSGASAPNGTTHTAVTGITITAAATGITISNTGAGSSQNMPPAAMVYSIIYAGV
jgi:microcystin-dependent protein